MKKKKVVKNRAKYTSKYFKKFAGRSQATYEDMVNEDYKNVIKRALELSSLEENDYDSLMMLTVPDAFDHQSKVTYRLDKKEDDTQTLLYDQALVTCVFFGDETLYYYRANVDHRNGHIGHDISGEFSYFDVVHLETILKFDNINKPKYLTLDIEVSLSDGTMIPFHLRNHHLHEFYDMKEYLTPEEKEFLDQLKLKVRQSRNL